MDSSIDATSEDQATMQVHTSVPSEETRTRGREGLRISAGEAFSARDISVGEVTQVTPVAKCCILDEKRKKEKKRKKGRYAAIVRILLFLDDWHS